MAITVSRLENGLYCHVWEGVVTLEETLNAAREMRHLTTLHQDYSYVSVIDMTNVRSIPTEIQGLRYATELISDVLAILVLNSPLLGKALGNILNRSSSAAGRFEFFEDREALLKRAREIIQKDNEAKTS